MNWWKNWKSKKTLRREASEYERLWLLTEDDLGLEKMRAQALSDQLLAIERRRTFVLARSRIRAEHMRRKLNLQGRETIILTEARSAEGLRVEPGDHVVLCKGWDNNLDLAEVWQRTMVTYDIDSDQLWVIHEQ